MTAVEILEQAKGTTFTNSEGKKWPLTIQPPATVDEISALEDRIGRPLPSEMKELLAYCFGIDGTLAIVNFVGALEYAFDLLPQGLPIADDGLGNFWMVDLTATAPEDTPVFMASHDPAVLVYQAASISEFISEALKLCNPPAKSEIERVREHCTMEIWKDNSGVISRQDCLAGDADLRTFAESLDDTYQFVDLRNAAVGQGFSWGRYGADTVSKRFGDKRIFAYQTKKLSWLQKLFGV